MKDRNLRILIAALFLALAFAVALPAGARAEGGSPPVETEIVPPQQTAEASEPVSTAEPLATDDLQSPSSTDEAVESASETSEIASATPVEATETEPAPEPETVQLAEAASEEAHEEPAPTSNDITPGPSEETQIIIVDSEGEILPLANQEAADSLKSGDPIWCPTSVKTPVNGGSGCSPSYTSFDELLTWLDANPQSVAGTIWIESTYKSSVNDSSHVGAFTLDGVQLSSMSSLALTIQGGWAGLGSNSSSGYSEFNHPLEILNWNADILLRQIRFTGVSGDSALVVETTKKVTMELVKATGNSSAGAVIDNAAAGTGTGDVFIRGGEFSSNTGGSGLAIVSRGAVTVENVFVLNNGTTIDHDGIFIDNSSAASPKPVTLRLDARFNGNAGNGAEILSQGNVSVSNVTARDNGGDGLKVDNTFAVKPQTVTITFASNLGSGDQLTNILAGNGLNGLYIQSDGAVTLKDLTAQENGSNGALIDNSTALKAQPVALSGANLFYANGGNGLQITTIGKITANSILANGNGAYGAVLENHAGPTAETVTLTGYNEFNYNGGGLTILSQGAVSIRNLGASSNSLFSGVVINNTFGVKPAAVTLVGASTFNSNGENGLEILSKGSISLAQIVASSNGQGGVNGYGAHLDNSSAPSPMSILASGQGAFSNNFDYGLQVESRGAITFKGLIADGNGSSGLTLSNLASGSNSLQNITLGVLNSAQNNGTTGLTVTSYGSISLASVNASGNGAYGASIDNGTGATPRPVSLTGYNIFSDNGGHGLSVISLGSIAASNVAALENEDFGAHFDNAAAVKAAPITVSGVNAFNDNASYGLLVESQGVITIYNFDASGNDSFGAHLKNNYTGQKNKVAITTTLANWCNGFFENLGRGLLIESFGAVAVTNVCSSANAGEGVRIDNSGATSAQSVTDLGTFNYHTENDETGLVILSRGAVTVSNLSAEHNGYNDGVDEEDGLGVYINNRAGGLSSYQNVTLSGSVEVLDNFYSGLELYSYGQLALANINAQDNGYGETDDVDKRGYGVLINNQTEVDNTPPKSITLTGSSNFDGNWEDGLKVLGSGAVTVSNISASNNGGVGVNLTNDYFAAAYTKPRGNLTVNGKLEANENAEGLIAGFWGSISIANASAFDNEGLGASLHTMFLPGVKVTLTGSNYFGSNGGWGLVVDTIGNIAVSNLWAAYNDDDGAWLDNSTGNGVISLSGSPYFTGNAQSGLLLTTTKPVSMSNVTSIGNGGDGLVLGSPVSIVLGGTNNLSYNGGNGLLIEDHPSVSLSNLTAIYNGQFGAFVDLTVGAPLTGAPSGFKLTGTNDLSNNGADGLIVLAYGPISVNNLTANGNGGAGAYLDNLWGLAYRSDITITGTNAFNNNLADYAGLEMYSNGNIRASNVTANGNAGGGATAWNWSSFGSPVSVTFSGINSFSNNLDGSDHGAGLYVKTEGAISLSNVTASGNADQGLYLDNDDFAWTPTAVTISGYAVTSGNDLNGIDIRSIGNVTLNRILSDLNGQSGVHVDTDGKVAFYCGSLNLNADRGWQLSAQSITIAGVFGYGNQDGMSLIVGGTYFQGSRNCSY